MNPLFSRYWWLFLIRGIVAVLLGAMALLWPVAAFTVFVIWLGAYMLVDGVFSLIAAISERKSTKHWGWLLVTGIFGILVGILTFINPFATATALVFLIACWALIIGISEIAMAISLRRQIRGEGWYILAGILTFLFGLMVMVYPATGALTLAMIFGIYALIIGIMLISLALRLRGHTRHVFGGKHSHVV